MIKYNPIVFKKFDYGKYVYEELSKEDIIRIFLYIVNNNCHFVDNSLTQVIGDFAVRLEAYLEEPTEEKRNSLDNHITIFSKFDKICKEIDLGNTEYSGIEIIVDCFAKLNYSIENVSSRNYYSGLNYQNRRIIAMCGFAAKTLITTNKSWETGAVEDFVYGGSHINSYTEATRTSNKSAFNQFLKRYSNYALSFYGEITNKENFTKKEQLFSILDNLTTQNQYEFIDTFNILSDFMQGNDLTEDSLIQKDYCLIYPWDKVENVWEVSFLQRVEISKVIKRWFGENILR